MQYSRTLTKPKNVTMISTPNCWNIDKNYFILSGETENLRNNILFLESYDDDSCHVEGTSQPVSLGLSKGMHVANYCLHGGNLLQNWTKNWKLYDCTTVNKFSTSIFHSYLACCFSLLAFFLPEFDLSGSNGLWMLKWFKLAGFRIKRFELYRK